MKISQLRTSSLAAAAFGLVLSATSLAHAQRVREPEDRQQQRAENRERRQNLTPEQRQQQWQQRLQNMTPEQRKRFEERRAQGGQNGGRTLSPEELEKLTPEQRQQWETRQQEMADARAERVRQILAAAGFEETSLQDAVIKFMEFQETARKPLQDAAQKLGKSLVGNAETDAQIAARLVALRESTEADTARYKTQLAQLDEVIGFSAKPRLEAVLILLGVVGDETPTLGGMRAFGGERGNRTRSNAAAAPQG